MIGSLLAGLMGQKGAQANQRTIDSHSDSAINALMQRYNEARRWMAPYQSAGQHAITMLNRGMTGNAAQRANFLGRFQQSPDYQFRLNEGIEGLDRSAAGQGMLLSGAHQKALMGYGQNLASGEYGNWWNRLNALAGQGQNAAQTAGGFGMQAGGAAANTLMQAGLGEGQARQSGYNALASGIGQGTQNMMFGMRMLGGGGMGGGGGGGFGGGWLGGGGGGGINQPNPYPMWQRNPYG